jgi:large subunit ribosomal protein L25
MEIVKLVVQKRHQAGKGVARRLRRAGQLPAVVYGNGTTLAIALAEKDLAHIQHSVAGENTILDFVIEGDTPERCQAILREVQIDPVSRASLHADFYRVDMNKSITVTVPLAFINEPHTLLLSANAMLTHLWREIEVACLPGDIPDGITVDLAHIHPGETFKAGALVLPPGVTLVTDAEEVLVTAHVEAETPEASSPEVVEA